MNREQRVRIAKETVEILEKGFYANRAGQTIDLKNTLTASIEQSMLYTPGMVESLRREALAAVRYPEETTIEVTNETTLHAARRCIDAGDGKTVCLNFASAKNPGGGFLNGSQAQEESLARTSGLYPCIAQMKEMYEYNRSLKSCLYSDYLIYSPDVPVFRDDRYELLDEPYSVSFITAPAVNAGVVREREPENVGVIRSVMRNRMDNILSVAWRHGYETVVLGAYGCGVFRNKPVDVAEDFKALIYGKFNNVFKRIVFAVYDKTDRQETFHAFESILRRR